MDWNIHQPGSPAAFPQPQPGAGGMAAGGITAGGLSAASPQTGLVIPGPGTDSGRLYLLIAPHPAVDRLMDALAVRLALAAGAAEATQAAGGGVPGPGRSAPEVYLHILDSGNRFDLHGIARGIARGIAGGIAGGLAGDSSRGRSAGTPAASPPEHPDWTRPAPTVEAILQRIRVARAFTCYQAEVLLAGVVECTGGSIHTQSIRPDQHRPAPITCTLTPQLDQPRPVPILATGLLTPFADENVPRGERLRLLGRCIQHLKRLADSAPVLVSAVPPAADVSAASIEAATAEAAEFLARLETAADQVWRFEAENAQAALLRQRRASSVPAGQLRMF